MRVVGGSQGALNVIAMSPFDRLDRAHTTSYSTLIETMRLSCTVFEIQPVICEKSPILPTQRAFGALIGGDPGRILRRSLASENQSPWAIVWCCLCNPLFSRFSRTPTCVRRTRTDRHRPMASTARGNERLFLLLTLLGVCRAAPVQRSGGRPSAVLRVCCCAPRGQEISIDYCCTSGAQQQRRRSKCEQCHVDSRRRKLNADSLVRQRATLPPNFQKWCVHSCQRSRSYTAKEIAESTRVCWHCQRCSSVNQFNLLGNKGPKATYQSQDTIYNDYSPRQCI